MFAWIASKIWELFLFIMAVSVMMVLKDTILNLVARGGIMLEEWISNLSYRHELRKLRKNNGGGL